MQCCVESNLNHVPLISHWRDEPHPALAATATSMVDRPEVIQQKLSYWTSCWSIGDIKFATVVQHLYDLPTKLQVMEWILNYNRSYVAVSMAACRQASVFTNFHHFKTETKLYFWSSSGNPSIPNRVPYSSRTPAMPTVRHRPFVTIVHKMGLVSQGVPRCLFPGPRA